ncbi:response regulator [Tepidiforma sp.]|uniref:response regulator n=1 Tax=Tepidiforma sp. TaxID=2682230 RepID=UPI002ADD98E6|nr:response regulator [Tepidiforma sp.]
MRILLAEDERTISRLIRQVLVNNGHEVTWCSSGAEAVALLERERFDLVLLDLHLADGDGMRVVAAIEAASKPGPPVVLMTGEGMLEADDPRSQRVATVLPKPFDLNELERMVDSFVA